MDKDLLLLGIDGGGTTCRARLCSLEGATLAEAVAGPANARLDVEESLASVRCAASQCLSEAGLGFADRPIIACIALAGASEPSTRAALERRRPAFHKALFTTDSHAACVGAHRGADGGVIIIGTGSVGEAVVCGAHHRVGGWGFPVSDEGSGAWLGCEAVRRALWASDGRLRRVGLVAEILARFDGDPFAIVRWMSAARPTDYASLAPLVIRHAEADDAVAQDLMQLSAAHIEALVERLQALGAKRIAIMGGLAASLRPWLSEVTLRGLVPPAADALAGAIELARAAIATGVRR